MLFKSITAPWPSLFSQPKHARLWVALLVMLKCSLRQNSKNNLKQSPTRLLLHKQLTESISSTTIPKRCLLQKLVMILEENSVNQHIRDRGLGCPNLTLL